MMSNQARRLYGVLAWILAAAFLIAGYLGFCSPASALKYPKDEATWSAGQRIVSWVGENYTLLLVIGLVLVAFNIFLKPFLLRKPGTRSSYRTFIRALPLTAFMVPGALFLAIFSYLPMPGIVFAFKTYKKARGTILNTLSTSAWVGLKNFSFIDTPRALATIQNTFVYNFFWMILGLILAVALAIMLSLLRNRRAVKIYQTGVFMPYFLSWVIASYLLFALLNFEKGLIGRLMPTDPYLNAAAWPLILTLCNVWKYLGYNSIVYSAAISGIDTELYEAATLDGAGTWQKIRYVTLPMLKPIMIIMTIMAMGRMANADFGLFYNMPMSSGPLTSTTDVFDTYVFRMLTGGRTNLGVTAAGSLFQSVLGFILIFTSNAVVRKISPENSLF